MRRTTLILVHHETDERETIDTTGEVTEEVVRHIPIPQRPTVHKPMPAVFSQLAAWIARSA